MKRQKTKTLKTRSTRKTGPSTKSLAPVKASLIPVSDTLQKAEALQAYLERVKEYPLLNPQSELEVAKRIYDNKDPDAAQKLVLSNLRLVVKIAYDYMRTGIHVLDLIQEGNIGLLQAVREYNPYRGVKFSSYASYWIKAYIRNFILKNWSLVKMGTTRAQRSLFYKLQKEKAKLELMGIVPERKYLADKLNVREKDIDEMSQRLSGRDVSLNAPVGSEEDGHELLHFVRDGAEGADVQLAENELREEFRHRLEAFERTLAGKELIIFRHRLIAENPQTLQEIADQYGITRERIRQIESRVMAKLKAFVMENAKFREQVIDVKR